MKNALFIHGFNSDKHSTTGARVKEVLESFEFSTQLKTFDMLSPFKTKKEIDSLLNDGEFDLVLGHSLGGFYTFVAQTSIKKIFINPCFKPEEDLKKISDIDSKVIDEFAQLNRQKISVLSDKNDEVAFGIFGKQDEFFSYVDLFTKYYGLHYEMLNCPHRPDVDNLKVGLASALGYFKSIN